MQKADHCVRYTMKELRKMYPDKWVILDECEWSNKSTIESGVLIGICEDNEVGEEMVESRHEGRGYMFRRTTEDVFTPIIQAVNFEVTT